MIFSLFLCIYTLLIYLFATCMSVLYLLIYAFKTYDLPNILLKLKDRIPTSDKFAP